MGLDFKTFPGGGGVRRSQPRSYFFLDPRLGDFTSKRVQLESGITNVCNKTVRNVLNKGGYRYLRLFTICENMAKAWGGFEVQVHGEGKKGRWYFCELHDRYSLW